MPLRTTWARVSGGKSILRVPSTRADERVRMFFPPAARAVSQLAHRQNSPGIPSAEAVPSSVAFIPSSPATAVVGAAVPFQGAGYDKLVQREYLTTVTGNERGAVRRLEGARSALQAEQARLKEQLAQIEHELDFKTNEPKTELRTPR